MSYAPYSTHLAQCMDVICETLAHRHSNKHLADLSRTTSPGGKLHIAQQHALQSCEAWLRLFRAAEETARESTDRMDENS